MAIVTHGFYPSIGGSERYHLFTARALTTRTVVRVFTSDSNLPPSARRAGSGRAEAGVDVEYLPSVVVANERLILPWRLLARLRRFHPSLVWTNQPSPTGDLAGILARVLGVPWAATYHADISRRPSWHRLYQRWENWLIRRADAVLVTSEHYRRRMLGRRVGPERVSAHPTGPYLGDGRVPREGDGATTFGAPGPEHALLFIGALDGGHAYKRLDLLLRAIARLRREGLDVYLRVVGDGDRRSQYEALSRDLGLAEAVSFLGRRSDLEVARELREAWALVLPAITDTEGFGTVAVEAAHCDCPFVVSDAVPASEVATKYGCGLIYSATDPGGFDQALSSIWTSRETRSALAQGARRARESLQWEVILPATLRPVLDLLRRSTGGDDAERSSVPAKA